MLFFNNFRLCLRIEFRDPAVYWMEVLGTKIGGFQLLVIVTKDLVLDVTGVLSFAVYSDLSKIVCVLICWC